MDMSTVAFNQLVRASAIFFAEGSPTGYIRHGIFVTY